LSKSSGYDYIASPLAGKILAPSGGDLVLAEWTAEGTPSGEEPQLIAPLHIHHHDDEAWYILEGTLVFQIGDATLDANTGGAVIAPYGKSHTFWNPNQTPARYLIIMTAQISALVNAIHATDERNPETMKKLFKQYGSDLL